MKNYAGEVVAIELAGLRGKLRKLAVRKELQALSVKNRNAPSSQVHHHRSSAAGPSILCSFEEMKVVGQSHWLTWGKQGIWLVWKNCRTCFEMHLRNLASSDLVKMGPRAEMGLTKRSKWDQERRQIWRSVAGFSFAAVSFVPPMAAL